MIIYGDGQIKIDPIPESELIQMGFKIKKFVDNYRKYVLIITPNGDGNNPHQILNTLEDIAHKMLTRQYNELFEDPRVVSTDMNDCPF